MSDTTPESQYESRDIVGFEGLYTVDTVGLIYSVRARRHMKPQDMKTNGYLRVRLSNNGVFKDIKVHRLVAEAFIPNPSSKPFVNHLNGDKVDNRVENLEWCTHQENDIHAVQVLGRTRGRNNGLVKLDVKSVLEIREMAKTKTYKEVAAKYKITEATLWSLLKGRTWSWVKDENSKESIYG